MSTEAKEFRFLQSALTEDNPFNSTADVLAWLRERAMRTRLEVTPVPLEDLAEWSFESETGDLVHRSGKFFRIHGIRVTSNAAAVGEWCQPIIDQPEIGILGIIVRQIGGRLFFLMQAKAEPGNVQQVQLTTTLQATRSNYTQVHQGARPKYVEYFLDRGRAAVLVDQLQFEQGSTFLRKRNRNMVVEVSDAVSVAEDHIWLTLGQIRRLLTVPNLVSMDARTVLSCIPLIERGWRAGIAAPTEDLLARSGGRGEGLPPYQRGILHSMAERRPSLWDDDDVLSWLCDLKSRYQLAVERVGLRSLPTWRRGANEIAHGGGRYFQVIGVQVEANSREVVRWDQPLVRSLERGLVAFITKSIGGVLHILVQGKVEPGNPDTVAVGPTVQCTLGYESLGDPGSWPRFTDLVLGASSDAIRYSVTQSEEGGRFYHVENDYRIVEVGDGDLTSVPDNYLWVTLRQFNQLLRFGLVNVEARSLAACMGLVPGPALTWNGG